MSDATVEEVLQSIEEKSDYYFLYNSRLINVERRAMQLPWPQKTGQQTGQFFCGLFRERRAKSTSPMPAPTPGL